MFAYECESCGSYVEIEANELDYYDYAVAEKCYDCFNKERD